MKNEEIIKAVGALGGGIASMGNACGALSGGVALISSLYSRGNLEEKEDPRLRPLSRKFGRKFQELTEEFGGVNCRDIARMDWTDKEAVEKFRKDPDSRRKFCLQVVGDAAYALGQVLEEDN